MKKFYTKISQLDLVITENNGFIVGIDFEKSDDKEKSSTIEQCIAELREYFKGERQNFEVKIELNGTEFQKSVWSELRKIPYGTVCSYKDIAKSIARSQFARAVGNANGKNHIPIIIPCHRIIRVGGGIGGYSGGVDIKRKLLEIEGVLI